MKRPFHSSTIIPVLLLAGCGLFDGAAHVSTQDVRDGHNKCSATAPATRTITLHITGMMKSRSGAT